jgi:hypothetical protein
MVATIVLKLRFLRSVMGGDAAARDYRGRAGTQ